MSRYQKGKTNLDFTEARDSEWQWHQLDHMQVCTSLQTDNNTSTTLLSFFTGRVPFLPPNQQCQCIEGQYSLTTPTEYIIFSSYLSYQLKYCHLFVIVWPVYIVSQTPYKSIPL